MESSERRSSRKRKHSPADNYQGNAYSEVALKPVCPNIPSSSHGVTNIDSNSEDINCHTDSAVDKCSDTTNVIPSSSCSINTVSGNSYKPSCYSELPETVMHNIYKFLPLKDLTNIRYICDSWKHNTDKCSVWKHAPLSLNDSNIERLSLAPYIHTVMGDIFNTELCVNVMVNNFQDLRRLNIYWYNYLSTIHVSKVVNKFSNLECILLNISAPDIIETLSALQNCPKLKEIKFSGFIRNINWTPFFNMLDKLKLLDTFDLTHLFPCVNSSELLYLLELKMKKLVSLKVHIDNCTNEDILNNIPTIVTKIICDSDRLEKLVFSTSANKLHADITLNCAEIKNLKSLELWLQSETGPNVLAQVTFPTSLEFLKLLFSGIPDTQKILQRVIESCPNLKYLNASYVEDEDINEQLERINRLQNLHTIILEYCPYLSSQGLQHISECSDLRVLQLTEASLDGTACNSLKSCKYIQDIKFVKCDIRPKMLALTILDLERLTHLSVVQCYRKNCNKKVWFSAKYFKHIFKKCKNRNPVLNISWK